MKLRHEILRTHPLGESEMVFLERESEMVPVDTFGGRVQVEWDSQVVVTALGQFPFFINFL